MLGDVGERGPVSRKRRRAVRRARATNVSDLADAALHAAKKREDEEGAPAPTKTRVMSSAFPRSRRSRRSRR